jgi:hypothetical protein
MAHVIIPNNRPQTFASPGVSINHMWLFPRAMMKAGWSYKGSAAMGVKDTSSNPLSCSFGAPTATGQSGSAASIGPKTGYDVTITGLQGMVAPTLSNKAGSEGNYLVFSSAANAGNNTIMQITEVISTGSVKARPVLTASSAVASDANNGSIVWSEYDMVTTPYNQSFSGSQYWIVLRGCNTLRMVFSGNLTGSFQRGEKVTQASTGAEGEIFAITYDPSNYVGWACIFPRVAGTDPSGPHGWATGSALAGASSAATVVPTSMMEYVTEVVFASVDSIDNRRRGAVTSWLTCCALDGGTEQNQLPSTLMSSAGCTSTLHPGGGGTGNSFPSLGMGFLGIPGSSNHVWMTNSNTDQNNAFSFNTHMLITNAIPRANRSPDGTFTMLTTMPSIGPYTFGGWTFQHLDDTEEGDVWPFAFMSPTGEFSGVWESGGGAGGQTTTMRNVDQIWAMVGHSDNRNRSWGTWRARGLQTGGGTTDKWVGVWPARLYACSGFPGLWPYATNSADSEKVASAAVSTLVREHVVLVNTGVGTKVRKGRPRWFALMNGGQQCGDTYANRTWIQCRDSGVNDANYGSFIVGPWDGTTSPVIS